MYGGEPIIEPRRVMELASPVGVETRPLADKAGGVAAISIVAPIARHPAPTDARAGSERVGGSGERMIERRCQRRSAKEALGQVGATRERRLQDFDPGLATERSLPGAIPHAEPAATDLFANHEIAKRS